MTHRNVPSGSQPPALRDAAPPVAARATRILRIEHPPRANSLIRLATLGQVGARAAPSDAPSPCHAPDGRTERSRCSSQIDSRDQHVAALRDAATDITAAAAGTRTGTRCAASAVRSPDLRYAGAALRHYEISFIANERLIEKLVHASALLGEQDDEPSIGEVLELAVDALICDCRDW
jgi:hypothetical protein